MTVCHFNYISSDCCRFTCLATSSLWRGWVPEPSWVKFYGKSAWRKISTLSSTRWGIQVSESWAYCTFNNQPQCIKTSTFIIIIVVCFYINKKLCIYYFKSKHLFYKISWIKNIISEESPPYHDYNGGWLVVKVAKWVLFCSSW